MRRKKKQQEQQKTGKRKVYFFFYSCTFLHVITDTAHRKYTICFVKRKTGREKNNKIKLRRKKNNVKNFFFVCSCNDEKEVSLHFPSNSFFVQVLYDFPLSQFKKESKKKRTTQRIKENETCSLSLKNWSKTLCRIVDM